MSEVRVVSHAGCLAEVATERFAILAARAITERGRFVVALAGGSTPRPMYRLLSQEPHRSAIDWSCVELFWGDERCVPPDHPDSNYRMVRRALLDGGHQDGLAIPDCHVHRIQGELPPPQAAAAYREELAAVLGEQGRFDLILLGLGPDGHTASLFPGTETLGERDQQVVAIYAEHLQSWRVTLTLPAINKARHVIFLVSGASKADVFARVRSGEQLPAGLVQPVEGTLTWLVDHAAAAALLPQGGAG